MHHAVFVCIGLPGEQRYGVLGRDDVPRDARGVTTTCQRRQLGHPHKEVGSSSSVAGVLRVVKTRLHMDSSPFQTS